MPKSWQTYRTGSILASHRRRFAGAGISEQGVPFAYHADWSSKGRWAVEAYTPAAAYRLCPLEQLFRKTSPLGEWEALPVTAHTPDVKAGFVEQVAYNLRAAGLPKLSYTLAEAAVLTRFGEQVYGYESD